MLERQFVVWRWRNKGTKTIDTGEREREAHEGWLAALGKTEITRGKYSYQRSEVQSMAAMVRLSPCHIDHTGIGIDRPWRCSSCWDLSIPAAMGLTQTASTHSNACVADIIFSSNLLNSTIRTLQQYHTCSAALLLHRQHGVSVNLT